ncbi:MAG: hypothetical protein R6V27_10120 [Balneolaceae bacterium]
MQHRLLYLPILIFAVFFLHSCDTSLDGELNENQPPKTSLTVDTIEVDEENRLSSRVSISWWGDDPDGYIIGYEFAISDTTEGNWNFTTQTDSTFILPITPGDETDDVLFAVRAVDNEDLVDPVGASVEFPLRNTPPVTEFNALELPPDTTYGLFSFGWTIDDPDGLQTIQRTEIAVNDTTNGWTEIPIEGEEQTEFFISLELEDQTQAISSANLFLGRSFRDAGIRLDGFEVNSENTIYVRTVDRALAQSETIEFSWFLKQRTSNVLVLNDDTGSDSNEKLRFHLDNLARLGIEPDVINITDGEGLQGGNAPLSEAFPRVIDPTLNRMLAKWDHIYHVSNSLRRNINYAQEILSRFFDEGGTLFSTIPIILEAGRENDPLFNFIPISEFVPIDSESAQRGFQLRDDFSVSPFGNGPELTYQGGINNNIRPFIPLRDQDQLYEAELLQRFVLGATEPHEGPSTIATMNPEDNFIYFGIDISTLFLPVDEEENYPPMFEQDISPLLEELLINRLGFSQQ